MSYTYTSVLHKLQEFQSIESSDVSLK